ncbi:MAG: hypothetical protein RLZZ450_1638, partial [Pseudomonadota bacterium]
GSAVGTRLFAPRKAVSPHEDDQRWWYLTSPNIIKLQNQAKYYVAA